MSSGQMSIQHRLARAAIDSGISADAAAAWNRIAKSVPSIVEAFYAHITTFPEALKLIGPQNERLARAQTAHWQRLFSGKFDEDYIASARAIGAAHVRVGVDPGLYIGGYNFVLGKIVHELAATGGFNKSARARLCAAATKVTLFDLELAISVYHDLQMEQAGERAGKLAAEISSFDRTFSADLKSLDEAARIMHESASRLGATTAETAAQATAVARTAEEMAGRVALGAEAGTRLNNSIAAIQGHAEQSLDIVRRGVEQARAADASVRGLNDMTDKIASVVDMITEIAERTNLLALNATIEAARAGEAGRGFAVVASEVKGLSTQTARATEEIAAQVRGIQEAMRRTVDDLGAIGRTIETVDESARAIASSVHEQSVATGEISSALTNVSSDAEGVAESIGNVRSASEETGSVSANVQTLAANLDEQARRMREDVKAFFERLSAA